MATVDEQKNAAIEIVSRRAQIAVAPVILESEIVDIAGEYQLASIWTDDEDYVVGQEIQPTVRNGHRYCCIVGGTSGDTEPDFPADPGSRVTDGDVIWQEVGSDYDNVFDIRGLTYAVMDMKVKRCAVGVDQKTPVGSLSVSQMYDHWRKERDGYAPLGVY